MLANQFKFFLVLLLLPNVDPTLTPNFLDLEKKKSRRGLLSRKIILKEDGIRREERE